MAYILKFSGKVNIMSLNLLKISFPVYLSTIERRVVFIIRCAHEGNPKNS